MCSEQLTPASCPSFDTCSAPLCPLDAESLRTGQWYPDEPICVREWGRIGETFPDFVTKQKRIQRAGASSDAFFTVAMLEAMGVARSGIRGIDPDTGSPAVKEQTWIGKRSRFTISEERRAELREAGKTLHQTRSGPLRGDSEPAEDSGDTPQGPGLSARSTPGDGGQ